MISNKKYLINSDLDQNIFTFIEDQNLIKLIAVNKEFSSNIKQVISKRDSEQFNQTFLYKYITYLTENRIIPLHKLNIEKILAKRLAPLVRMGFIEYQLQEFNIISEKSFSFIMLFCTNPDLLFYAFPVIYNRFKFLEDLDELDNLLDQLNELANIPEISRYILRIMGNLYQNQEIEVPVENSINYCLDGLKYFRHPAANKLIKLFSEQEKKKNMEQQIKDFLKLESFSEEELETKFFGDFKINQEQAHIIFDAAIWFYQNNNPKIKLLALQALLNISLLSPLDDKTEVYPIIIELIKEHNLNFLNLFNILPKDEQQSIINFLIKEFHDADKIYKNIFINYLLKICVFSEKLNDKQIKNIFDIFVLHYDKEHNYYDKDHKNFFEEGIHDISLLFKRLNEQDCQKAFDIIINYERTLEGGYELVPIYNIFKYLKCMDNKNIALNMLIELCDDPDTYIIGLASSSLISLFPELNSEQQRLVFNKLNFINFNVINIPNFYILHSYISVDMIDISNKMLIKFSYEKFLQGTDLCQKFKSHI